MGVTDPEGTSAVSFVEPLIQACVKELTVFNRDGNPDAGATMLEVPVSGFATGVYMVSLESAGKRSFARLIVE